MTDECYRPPFVSCEEEALLRIQFTTTEHRLPPHELVRAVPSEVGYVPASCEREQRVRLPWELAELDLGEVFVRASRERRGVTSS